MSIGNTEPLRPLRTRCAVAMSFPRPVTIR
jgi:hypothetical protein